MINWEQLKDNYEDILRVIVVGFLLIYSYHLLVQVSYPELVKQSKVEWYWFYWSVEMVGVLFLVVAYFIAVKK